MLDWLRNLLRSEPEPSIEEDREMAANARIIVGLGNPGRNYTNTRHNIGFMVVDELAKRSGESTSRTRFNSEILDTRFPTGKTILIKPQTFMNKSGHAVREVRNWYRVDLEQILVVVDDLDLPFGQMRLRQRGSAGGHNGLRSIIEQVGTDQFPRLRVGIGRGRNQARAHVLSNFAPSEQEHLPRVIDASADAVELWMREGMVAAMNEINGRPSVLPEQETPDETSV